MAGPGGSQAYQYNVQEIGCTNCGKWVHYHEAAWVRWHPPKAMDSKWERWCKPCFYAKAVLDELWNDRHSPEARMEAEEGLKKVLQKLESKRNHSIWERAVPDEYVDYRRSLRLPEDLHPFYTWWKAPVVRK